MAHTFLNLGFETGADIPGGAYGWDQAVVSSVIEIANFGYVAASPYETWEEGWNTDAFLFAFAQTDLEAVQWPSGDVDPLSAEGFEYGWTNETWSGELSAIEEGVFANATTTDDFETGWANDAWAGTLSGELTGLFDTSVDHESFNFEFVSNGNPLWEGLIEIYSTSVARGVGGSEANWPVGVEFANNPTRQIILPGGVYDFEDVYVQVGDDLFTNNSDVGDSNERNTVTAVAGDTVTMAGTWDNTGIATTPVQITTMNKAAFEANGAFNPPNAASEKEYFDTGAWPVMDTL